MRRKSLFMLGLFTLLLYFLSIRFNQTQVKAPTSYPVHNLNTGLNYTNIQDAIDAIETSDGHTIAVDEGWYYESVVVTKSITLLGSSRNTIISGSFYARIRINASNVKVSGFTLRGADNGIMVLLHGGNSITDNTIIQNERGISLSNCYDNNISGNTISGNRFDNIQMFYAHRTSISTNVIADSQFGIFLHGGDCTIFSNDIINNTCGVLLEEPWFPCKVFHNNFINNEQQGAISWSDNAT